MHLHILCHHVLYHFQGKISSLQQEISSLENVINTKAAEESKWSETIKELESKMDVQSQRHSAIESKLLNQLSCLRKDQQETVTKHEAQIAEMEQRHEVRLKEDQQQFDNLRQQKVTLDSKLQEVMESNDSLMSKLQDLQQKQQGALTEYIYILFHSLSLSLSLCL